MSNAKPKMCIGNIVGSGVGLKSLMTREDQLSTRAGWNVRSRRNNWRLRALTVGPTRRK